MTCMQCQCNIMDLDFFHVVGIAEVGLLCDIQGASIVLQEKTVCNINQSFTSTVWYRNINNCVVVFVRKNCE